MSRNHNEDQPDSTNPMATLLQAAGGVLLVRAITTITELRIPDLLADAPRDAEHLANLTDAEPRALYRVMRMLAGLGYFGEDEQGLFCLTPVSELLCTGHPHSLSNLFALPWQDLSWPAYRHLPETVRSGEPGFEIAHGEQFFTHLARNPQCNQAFDDVMRLFSAPENEAIAAVCNLPPDSRVVDIAGGQGGLLATLLGKQPSLRGVLYEQAQVLDDPRELVRAGLLDRCELVGGDFFVSVPTGGDVYLLKRIVHDWDDDAALRLLSNCRAAMSGAARLLIIDAIMEPGGAPDANKTMDVSIMTLTRGRERSASELSALLAAADLKLERLISTPEPATLTIAEATAA